MIVEVEPFGAEPLRIAGVPIKLTLTPGGVRRRAPRLGENTIDRLREAGLTEAEIAGLIERRVAAATPQEPTT